MLEFENIWTEYIIHHNLYESFDLILYNFSHLVSECYEIHHCTRTKVQIPSDGNFFLIHQKQSQRKNQIIPLNLTMQWMYA